MNQENDPQKNVSIMSATISPNKGYTQRRDYTIQVETQQKMAKNRHVASQLVQWLNNCYMHTAIQCLGFGID